MHLLLNENTVRVCVLELARSDRSRFEYPFHLSIILVLEFHGNR